MATLPRYEQMGVQYADLPRVSTAALAVAAEGYSRMSQQIDRMVNFLQSERETEAQRKAKRYAIENPLTQEQVDAAISGKGPGLQVPGAGEIFQRTYEEMQGAMLASELQAEGQRKIGEALAVVKAGGTIDLDKTQSDLRDLIDGYATSVAALDPEESVRLRASLSLAGKSLFTEAAAQQIKRDFALINAGMEAAADSIKPVFEGIIAQAGTIDPQTGKPLDVDKMLQSQLKPFQDVLQRTGNAKPLETALAAIRTAKVDAIVGFATKDEFAANPLKALRRLTDGDLGNLSKIYKGLSQDDKEVVRKRVRDYSVDMAAAQKAEADKAKDDAARAARVLELELIDEKTTAARRREVVNTLVRGGHMSLESARTALKPPTTGITAGAEAMVSQKIRMGIFPSLSDFLADAYKNGMSEDQIRKLSKELLDENYKRARFAIDSAAGIVGFELNPGEAKIEKRIAIDRLFYINLGKDMPPQEAASEAVNQYNNSETVKKREAVKQRVTDNVRTILEGGGFAMPNVQDIENMDLNVLRDGRGRPISDAMRKKLQTELDTLRAGR